MTPTTLPPTPPTLPHAVALAPPTDAEQVSFDEAVELFLGRTRHTRSGSGHTQRAYRSDLDHFGLFLASSRLALAAVARRDAQRYLVRLSATAAARSVQRRVYCVRSFYRFLRGIDLVQSTRSTRSTCRRSTARAKTHKVLSDDELGARRRPARRPTSPRQTAALGGAERHAQRPRLLQAVRRRPPPGHVRAHGLRRTSLRRAARAPAVGASCSARTASASRSRARAPSRASSRSRLRLPGAVRTGSPSAAACRRAPTRSLSRSPAAPSTPAQIARECAASARRADARHRLTPHVLRRTFATRSLRASGDIRAVQTLLGHASISTTEVYTHVDEEGLRRVVEATALPDGAPLLPLPPAR